MNRRLALTGLLGLLFASTLAAQDEAARERWQRVSDVFAALGVAPASRIADVGAGGGFFTARLARAVGQEGRVFALDVDGDVVAGLRRRAAREQWTNVEIIHSAQGDPRLPDGTIDAALIMNAYHEFTNPDAMLQGLARALKPGGRIVIIDQIPSAPRLQDQRDAHQRAHELGSWFAVYDLLLAGFRIARLEDPFIVAGDGGAESGWWILVGQRP